MRKEKETTLSGIKFRVTQLGFEDSIDLFVPLCKTLGPSIGALFSGVTHDDTKTLGDAQISPTGITQALTELARARTSRGSSKSFRLGRRIVVLAKLSSQDFLDI